MASEEDDIVEVLGRYYPPPPQRTVMMSLSVIRRAEREILELRDRLDKMELAYIEASNRGIDMEKVKAERTQSKRKS